MNIHTPIGTACLDPVIDHLGEIKAKIVELEKVEKTLRDMLAERGAGAYEGHLFRAVVTVAPRETVDWKAVALKLEPSHQLLTAHTTTKSIVTVKVGARTGEGVLS